MAQLLVMWLKLGLEGFKLDNGGDNSVSNFAYDLSANDIYFTLDITTNMTGSGSVNDPYLADAISDDVLTLLYHNKSSNLATMNLNFNINQLPYGLVVDSAATTCPTGSEYLNLAPSSSCVLSLHADYDLLTKLGGSVSLDFVNPTVTWTTPNFGVYSQQPQNNNGVITYVKYAQPSISFVLSESNTSKSTKRLTITGTQLDKGVSGLDVNVSGVKNWLQFPPVTSDQNCRILADDGENGALCSLSSGSNTGNITYTMPDYLRAGESADIPLVFSISSSAFAYLDPSYTFIHYVAAPKFIAYYPSGCTLNNTAGSVVGTCECIKDNLTGNIWTVSDVVTGQSMWTNWCDNDISSPGYDAACPVTHNSLNAWNDVPHCGKTGNWHLPTATSPVDVQPLNATNPGGNWSELYNLALAQSGNAFISNNIIGWMNNNGFASIGFGALRYLSTKSDGLDGIFVVNLSSGAVQISPVSQTTSALLVHSGN